MNEIVIDPDRQTQAKKYARISRRLMLANILLGAGYALIWIMLGWSAKLETILEQATTNPWLIVAGFGIIFGGIIYLISLPISYYEDFFLPHRFELSNQTIRGWIGDQIKSLAVGIPLGLLILEVIYGILRIAPNSWWIWASIFLIFFNVILIYLAPILLFPIFNKFLPLEQEYQELSNRLLKLAESAGTRVQGVFKFDMSRRTKAANAALTGSGNTRRIILGDTLLEQFSTDEIETVLAHELAHHVHKDISKGMIVEILITLVGLYLASLALSTSVEALGFETPADIATLPLFILIMGSYGLVTMPMTNAYSRWRERLADQYALEVTQKPAEFASAMVRLANLNLAEVDPEPWAEFLLYSHPSLKKRINMAEKFSDSYFQEA